MKYFFINNLFNYIVQRGGGCGGYAVGEQSEIEVPSSLRNDEETLDAQEEQRVSSETEEGEEEMEEGEERRHRQVGNNFKLVTLLSENAREFKKFRILGREASFAIRPVTEGSDIYSILENAFREIHAYVVQKCGPGDLVGISFDSANLTHGPAGLSFRPAHDLTHGDIWGLVSSVAQSAGGLDIAQEFNIRVFNVAVPSGRGRVKLTREDITAKRSILSINNTDNLCFPRSLVTARIYCERGNLRTGKLHEKWNAVRRSHSSLQRELALQLTKNAGVTMSG